MENDGIFWGGFFGTWLLELTVGKGGKLGVGNENISVSYIHCWMEDHRPSSSALFLVCLFSLRWSLVDAKIFLLGGLLFFSFF